MRVTCESSGVSTVISITAGKTALHGSFALYQKIKSQYNNEEEEDKKKKKKKMNREKPLSSFFFLSPLALCGFALPVLGAIVSQKSEGIYIAN